MSYQTIKERVYMKIYQSIIEGEWLDKTYTEGFLATKYDVSRTSVREALIELCAENILQNIPRKGYQLVTVTLKEFLDALEFRLILETTLLRKAFPEIREENIQELRKLAQPLAKDHLVSEHWKHNKSFHLALSRLNDNKSACEALEGVLKIYSRNIAQYFHAARNKSRESDGVYHQAVVDALEKQDIDQACEMLKLDIMAVKREVWEMFN